MKDVYKNIDDTAFDIGGFDGFEINLVFVQYDRANHWTIVKEIYNKTKALRKYNWDLSRKGTTVELDDNMNLIKIKK